MDLHRTLQLAGVKGLFEALEFDAKAAQAADEKNQDLKDLNGADIAKIIDHQRAEGRDLGINMDGDDFPMFKNLGLAEIKKRIVQAEFVDNMSRPKVSGASRYFGFGNRKFWEYDVMINSSGEDKMHTAWVGTAEDGKTIVITISKLGKTHS